MRRRIVFTSLLAIVACSDAPTTCPQALAPQLSPADTAVRVGDRFQARVRVFACGDSDVTTEYALDWQSRDTSVVRTDASGMVTGVSKGVSAIDVFGTRAGTGLRRQLGEIAVTVR